MPARNWTARSLDDKAGRAIKAVSFEKKRLVKAKKTKAARKPFTAADIKLLKQRSKARTRVVKISKEMERSIGSPRQKAQKLGIGL